jgi:excisionase family DNA binding protein
MSTNPPKFYTVREAATLLRVKPKTIRRRILSKKLIATKPNGSQAWLIPESALKQVLNDGVLG